MSKTDDLANQSTGYDAATAFDAVVSAAIKWFHQTDDKDLGRAIDCLTAADYRIVRSNPEIRRAMTLAWACLTRSADELRETNPTYANECQDAAWVIEAIMRAIGFRTVERRASS